MTQLTRDHMTIKETADYLRVSQQMVGRAIKRGQLEAFQLVPNGKILISVTSIRRMMEASRIGNNVGTCSMCREEQTHGYHEHPCE